MTIDFVRSTDKIPGVGTWRSVQANEAGERRCGVKAICRCPKCGYESSVVNHSIAADGTLHPSYVCPHEKLGCVPPFHDWVRLSGWDEGAIPAGPLHTESM